MHIFSAFAPGRLPSKRTCENYLVLSIFTAAVGNERASKQETRFLDVAFPGAAGSVEGITGLSYWEGRILSKHTREVPHIAFWEGAFGLHLPLSNRRS